MLPACPRCRPILLSVPDLPRATNLKKADRSSHRSLQLLCSTLVVSSSIPSSSVLECSLFWSSSAIQWDNWGCFQKHGWEATLMSLKGHLEQPSASSHTPDLTEAVLLATLCDRQAVPWRGSPLCRRWDFSSPRRSSVDFRTDWAPEPWKSG